MAETTVRDLVIWAKHVHGPDVVQRISRLRGGEMLDLVVDGVRGTWLKMADGRDGRPTSGIRPVGRMEQFWRELYANRRGDVVPLTLVEGESRRPLSPALARSVEDREAARAAIARAGELGWRSEGRTITREALYDRDDR
jgi:hypothetical protein